MEINVEAIRAAAARQLPKLWDDLNEDSFRTVVSFLQDTQAAFRQEIPEVPPEEQTVILRFLTHQVAMVLPFASLGGCVYDGTDLHFEGREDGLYMCCSAEPQHCWLIGPPA